MPFNKRSRPESEKSLLDFKPVPFWVDDSTQPEPVPPLTRAINADLAIVGAGYTGLWTALLAKESNPERDIVLIEADVAGSGASGRNGGFVDHCLTHTYENGMSRWRDEMPLLIRMGYENLDAIEETVKRYNIDCDFIRSGEIVVATEPYQADELRQSGQPNSEWIDRDELRSMIHSPLYFGGLYDKAVALVNPARLVWGLRRACLDCGIRLFERSPATGLEEEGNGVVVRTDKGQVKAKKVVLATNAFPPLLKRLAYYVAPVYDYALMTEPLTDAQRASIGWRERQGLGDAANQFHYYRTTEDGRILWGGYDAIYYWNNGMNPRLERNPETWARLADHFFATFPQLEGLRFTHAWGGAIDTCSRFSVFWGKALRGKVVYALGYTGLGVGASRFGAQVTLDLLDNKDNERTRLKMVQTKPIPFPPEPFRSPIVNVTRWSMARADENNGKRNLWLKALDALGLGFDS